MRIGPQPDHRTSARVIALASMLVPLSSTMVAVVLPALAGDLGVRASTASWAVTGYLLAMALGQPLAGRAGDRLGRPRALRWGLWTFGAASAVAMFAGSFPPLVAARAVQGLGGSLILPNGLALLRETAGRRLGRDAGALAAAMTLAAAAGPLLGALLLAAGGWRGIFLVNVLLVAAVLGLVRGLLPSSAGRRPRTPMGTPGARRVLRRRAFLLPAAGIAAGSMGLYALIVGIPLLLARRGLPPGSAALTLTALSAGSFLAAPVGGRLADALGRRAPAVLGTGVLAAALVPLAAAPKTLPLPAIALALATAGVGLGIGTPALQAAALEAVTPRDAGLAAGLASSARYLGSIAGTTLVAWALAAAREGLVGLVVAFTVAAAVGMGATVLALGLPGLARRASAAVG